MKLLPTTDPKAINDRAAHAAGLPAVVRPGETKALATAVYPVLTTEEGDAALIVTDDNLTLLTNDEKNELIDPLAKISATARSRLPARTLRLLDAIRPDAKAEPPGDAIGDAARRDEA